MSSVQERRLRRYAARKGWRLEKATTRNPDAPEYGRYRVVEIDSGRPVAGVGFAAGYLLTLEAAGSFLGALRAV